jgi:hypothetical protein
MKKLASVFSGMLLIATTLFAQEQPTGVLMNLFAKDMAQPKGISENGKWACGSAFWTGAENQAGTINASKWNLETGERIFLTEEEVMSDAYCISNDGSLVCGSFLGEPAYNLNGEWIALPTPRGYNAGGDVTTMAVVGTDTIMMGYAAKSQTEQVIVRWVNGKIDNDFKLRDYTRYAEIMGDSVKGETGIVRGMSNDGERYLVSLDYNLLPSAGSTNLPTTFVQFGGDENYTTTVIEREFDIYDLVSFVEEATMSFNGKYVCGRMHAVAREGYDAPESPSVSFTYDVDNDEFIHYGDITEIGRFAGASCIDNQGHTYFKSINGNSPLGKPYIYKNGEYVELEKILLSYNGITEAQIDAIVTDEVEDSDEDDLGIVWAVSADGKTLIGAGGALKGNIWCAKLECSPYDVDSYTNVENITYNKLIATYTNGTITLSDNANKIEIYSITGAKIMSKNIEGNTLKAELNKGIYVVKIHHNNQISTSKIIVK